MRVLLVVAAILTASPAFAKTWYVVPSNSSPSPCSSGNCTGTDGSPTTIGYTNTHAGSGDYVVLKNRTGESVTTYPAGSADRISPSANNIHYRSKALNPAAVILTEGVSTDRDAIALSHLTIAGPVVLQSSSSGSDADHDSVYACVLQSGFAGMGIDYAVIAFNTVSGGAFNLLSASGDQFIPDTLDAWKWSNGNVVKFNRISNTASGPGGALMTIQMNKFLEFRSNHSVLVGSSSPTGNSGVKIFHLRDSKIADNFWDITSNCASSGSNCDEAGMFVIRDRSYRNVFLRDTVIVTGSGDPIEIKLSHPGNAPCGGYVYGSGQCASPPAFGSEGCPHAGGCDCPNSCITPDNTNTEFANEFIGCFFKNLSPGGKTWFHDPLQNNTVLNSVFVATERSLYLDFTADFFDADPSEIRHCTFWQTSETGAAALEVRYDDEFSGPISITDNVIASNAGGVSTDDRAAGRYVPHPANNWNGQMTELDRNLYYQPELDPIVYDTWGSTRVRSVPGPTGSWYSAFSSPHYDGSSVAGDPLFTDDDASTFDFRPGSGSPAVGGSWPDGYVGADPYAPDPVGDLEVAMRGKNTIMLNWSVPQDEGVDCGGTLLLYEVRRSTSAITEANFSSATLVGTWDATGSEGTECLTVSGLTACQTHHIAVRVKDCVGNTSAIDTVITSTKCSGADYWCDDGLALRHPGGGGSDDSQLDHPIMIRAYPNPAGSEATLSFAIPRNAHGQSAELSVFDVVGRKVRTIHESPAISGTHSMRWDLTDSEGRKLNSGVYFVRLRVGAVESRTLLIKNR